MKTYSGIIKLMCLTLVVPLLIWMFALKQTVFLYKEVNKMQKESQSISLHPSKDEEQQASLLPSKPLLSNGKILQIFADSLTALKVDVTHYMPELVDAEGECKLYLGKLILAGRYIELVKMVAIIEQARLPVKVASLSFHYDRTRRNSSSFITMTMYVEQIEYE